MKNSIFAKQIANNPYIMQGQRNGNTKGWKESEKEKELSRWKTWEAYSEFQDWRGALCSSETQ